MVVKTFSNPAWMFMGIFVAICGLVVTVYYSLVIGLVTFLGGAMLTGLAWVLAPKFKAICIIAMSRHGKPHIFIDKGSRFDHGDGTYYYMFKKLKDETKAAKFDSIYSSNKGEVVLFNSPSKGEYYSMTIEEYQKIAKEVPINDKFGKPIMLNGKPVTRTEYETKAIIKPIPDNLKEWFVLKTQRNRAKYLLVSAWDKYYPLIVLAITGIVLMIVITSVINSMNPIVDSFKEAAASNARAAETNTLVADRLIQLVTKNYTTQIPGIDTGLPTRPPGT